MFLGGLLALLAATLAGLIALIGRFRRAEGQQRQQLKWFAYAALVLAVSLGLSFTPWNDYWIGLAGLGLFTTGVAVAIVRHHLYDIDLLINRTLVYGLLTALVVGLYVATVGLLGVVLQQRGGLLASLVATGVVAVVFQPLRERLQRAVNRLLYGDRQDPYKVLAGLGQRLEATVAPHAVLPGVVETIAGALRLPYVAVELGHGDDLEPVAVHGRVVGEPLAVPLVYQAEPIGRLLLGPRAPGEPFLPADRRLLADLAGPVAMAASAVQLTTDLSAPASGWSPRWRRNGAACAATSTMASARRWPGSPWRSAPPATCWAAILLPRMRCWPGCRPTPRPPRPRSAESSTACAH